jgi:hypothetical protein
VFNFVTRMGSSYLHLTRGTVKRKLFVSLALGWVNGSYG